MKSGWLEGWFEGHRRVDKRAAEYPVDGLARSRDVGCVVKLSDTHYKV